MAQMSDIVEPEPAGGDGGGVLPDVTVDVRIRTAP
jgi:hypothetical protein